MIKLSESKKTQFQRVIPRGCTLFVIVRKKGVTLRHIDIYHFYPDPDHPEKTCSSWVTNQVAYILGKTTRADCLVLKSNGAGNTLYTDLIEEVGQSLYGDAHGITCELLT